jgi:hypothetical protein
MNFAIERTSKFVVLNFLSLGVFRLIGGEIHLLWQPYQLFLIVGSIATLIAFTKAKFRPAETELEAAEQAGAFKDGIVFGGIAASILTIVVALSNTRADLKALQMMVAYSLAAPYLAFVIYVSFKPSVRTV